MNDLLQRKATWTGPDVIRFTELVQTEHENDKAEKEAKEAMDAAEAEVEKGFSGAKPFSRAVLCSQVQELTDSVGLHRHDAGHLGAVPRGASVERQGASPELALLPVSGLRGTLGRKVWFPNRIFGLQIRSMSTYGSLAITSLNVLLFIISLLLIEPWRRRRLVENVEERSVSVFSQSEELCMIS